MARKTVRGKQRGTYSKGKEKMDGLREGVIVGAEVSYVGGRLLITG